jgi:hypothetical protein
LELINEHLSTHRCKAFSASCMTCAKGRITISEGFDCILITVNFNPRAHSNPPNGATSRLIWSAIDVERIETRLLGQRERQLQNLHRVWPATEGSPASSRRSQLPGGSLWWPRLHTLLVSFGDFDVQIRGCFVCAESALFLFGPSINA